VDDDRERALFRGRPIERMIFATGDDAEITDMVARFCRGNLGADVREGLFARTSVAVVFGLALDDGRRVVVKAHQPSVSVEFLGTVVATQTLLADEGFPCPRPLLVPAQIGSGFATVEELIEDGSFADPHEPRIRRSIARALARQIELARPHGQSEALGAAWSLFGTSDLWPDAAHSPIFDFTDTAAGAEWIDEIGREAKPLLADGAERIVVHTDWSGKHFRFDADANMTVVYDWDSLGLRTEAQALGIAAATFTSCFELDIFYAPTPDEVASFIDDYSEHRATPLSEGERRTAHSIAGYLMAYAARCEHALGKNGHFSQALARHGLAYLTPSSGASAR
jgi:Phosphotransferase enzyme family